MSESDTNLQVLPSLPTLVTIPQTVQFSDPAFQAQIDAIVAGTPAGHGTVELTYKAGSDVHLIAVEKVGDHVSVIGFGRYDFLTKEIEAGLSLKGSW